MEWRCMVKHCVIWLRFWASFETNQKSTFVQILLAFKLVSSHTNFIFSKLAYQIFDLLKPVLNMSPLISNRFVAIRCHKVSLLYRPPHQRKACTDFCLVHKGLEEILWSNKTHLLLNTNMWLFVWNLQNIPHPLTKSITINYVSHWYFTSNQFTRLHTWFSCDIHIADRSVLFISDNRQLLFYSCFKISNVNINAIIR